MSHDRTGNESEKGTQPTVHERPRLPRAEIEAAIETILSQHRDIEKQSVLLAKLEARGFHPSEASLSRILRSMGVKKINNVWSLDPAREKAAKIEELTRTLQRHAKGVAVPTKLMAVETTPGFARALGVLAQQAYPEEVIGSIADDNIVLLMMSDKGGSGDLGRLIQDAVGPGRRD